MVNNLLEKNYENKEEYDSDIPDYFNICNTYKHLSTSEQCDHSEGEKALIFNNGLNWKEVKNKQFLPMQIYLFSDKQALQDTYSFIIAFTHFFGNNSSEKEKVRNMTHIIMKGLFGLEYKPLPFDETIDHENPIILGAAEIENKIYTKIYSYMTQQMYVHLQEEIRNAQQHNLERQESVLSQGGKIRVEDEENFKTLDS